MKLGELLRKWRAMSELDLKQAGAQIGIAASTLMRIEQGKVPDGETLLKLMRWIFSEEAAAPQSSGNNSKPVTAEVQTA